MYRQYIFYEFVEVDIFRINLVKVIREVYLSKKKVKLYKKG